MLASGRTVWGGVGGRWGEKGWQSPWIQVRKVLGVIFQNQFPQVLFPCGDEPLGLLIFLSFPLPQEPEPSRGMISQM